MILRAYFFDNNEEFGQNGILGQPPRLIYDPNHSLEEERFLLLGISYKLNVLIVVHCTADKNSEIRIISARKATKNEQKQYIGHLQ